MFCMSKAFKVNKLVEINSTFLINHEKPSFKSAVKLTGSQFSAINQLLICYQIIFPIRYIFYTLCFSTKDIRTPLWSPVLSVTDQCSVGLTRVLTRSYIPGYWLILSQSDCQAHPKLSFYWVTCRSVLTRFRRFGPIWWAGSKEPFIRAVRFTSLSCCVQRRCGYGRCAV